MNSTREQKEYLLVLSQVNLTLTCKPGKPIKEGAIEIADQSFRECGHWDFEKYIS